MELLEVLQTLKTPKQRQFLMMLVSGWDLADVKEQMGAVSFFRWLHNPAFKEALAKVPALYKDYSEDARAMLRLHNVNETLGIERTILDKIKDELKSGNYDLIKTNIGRSVLAKANEGRLLEDVIRKPPKEQTWKDRVKEWGITVHPVKTGKKCSGWTPEQGGELPPDEPETPEELGDE